ncbi:uncharacterized protein LOC117339813, partial [Pecten maximus]|uniref:uncharacterized protein LOC117339813 n=1 Tax=Pecten maximus TaxID=6579 RepID=UPI001458654F
QGKVLKENLSSDDLTAESRLKVLHHLVNGRAALYIACEEGDLDVIRYLVSECKVDIEQRGHYTHKHFHDQVSPLWSCTEQNAIEVVRLLISLGANINCTSSTNGTALLVGCLHNSEECVKELIKAGADVNIPNIYGATPLLNAASKGSLDLCEYLINNGADVKGRDCNDRTTLHRAVEENRLDVVKLLIEKGCDCMLQNDTEESPFRLAALKGNHGIVEYLAKNISLDSTEVIETYELLGAFHAEKDDYEKASQTWLTALEMRDLLGKNPMPKKICDTLEKCTEYKEVSSFSEIKGLTSKEDFMMQSLLVRERILRSSHSETIWSLDYCGAVYADMNQYSKCIQLWKCAYRRLVDKRNNCGEDSTFRIQAIMKVFVDMVQEKDMKFLSKDLLDIFEILISSMQCGSKRFRVRPREELAGKQISILMKMALQLMNLILMQDLNDSDKEQLLYLAECAVKTYITDEEGRTLLHLSMEEKTSTTNEYTYTLFPSFKVLKLLVDVGANVNSMDNKRNTVLHYCAKPESHKAAEYLLDNHAHADMRNSDGESALEQLITSGYRVCPMVHCTLKCLAATAVTRNKITSWECLPKTLYTFVEIHGLQFGNDIIGLVDQSEHLVDVTNTGLLATMTPEKIHSYALFIHKVIQTRNDKLKVLKENLTSERRLLTIEGCYKVLHHLVNGKAALYVACEEGDLDVIRYLVSECKVYIEQRGHYTHKHFQDQVSPLWSCTEQNAIEVVRLLINLGADFDFRSSTGDTPLMRSCLFNNVECVKMLLKAGADVNASNIYGVTALLNAVITCSVDLCRFLINNGADVRGRDIECRTALHRAVQHNRLDVVKLLIERGCDCSLQNSTGDNPFRLAALKGNHSIVEYLVQNVSFETVEVIETYELLGTSDVIRNDTDKASKTWLIALALRGLHLENPILKTNCDTTGNYTDIKEVSSSDEIRRLTSKEDFMMQSLLIRERILGPTHSLTLTLLKYCGEMYADVNDYRNSLQLWKCAYKRLVDMKNKKRKYVILYNIMQIIVRDFIQEDGIELQSSDLLDVFETLVDDMQHESRMFRIQPREKLAAVHIVFLMKMALQLMYILLSKDPHDTDRKQLMYLAETAVKTHIKDEKDRTLLHMSMDESTSYTIQYRFHYFPSFKVLRLLVDVGANVNSMDNKRNTVLHYCAKAKSHKAAEYLLDNHVHADVRNRDGESALEILKSSGYRVDILKHCTLQCLAANAVPRNETTQWENLPKIVHWLIETHAVQN